jgi:hypothetical protein
MHLKRAPVPGQTREPSRYGQGRSWPRFSQHGGASAGTSNNREREEQ